MLAEALGQAVGADRASGLPAGEQPGRGAIVADGGVAAAGGEKLPDEAGEGLGQDDGLAAEAQPYLPVIGVDVAQGEAADGRRPLGVEENEEPRDAVFGIEAGVVEQPSCLVPAGLGVDDPDGPPQRVAGKSRLVSFCFVAQRMKCPVSRR